MDGVHQPRPVSKLFTEFVAESRQRGMIASADRYGSFARGNEIRYVHRFAFGQPRVLIRRPPGDEASARAAFGQALQADDARRLVAAAARVFTERLWREDVRRWDDEVRPVLMARTLELAATDVSALSNDELVEHIDACIEHLKGAGTWHHTFNNTWMVPLGDFAAHAIEWTGLAPARLASLLRGSSLLSAGDTPERARLVAALAADSGAAAVLASDLSPAECIERLMALPGEAGVAARLYIRTIGYLSMGGFDVIDRYALERPDAIVDGIRRSLTGQGDGSADEEALQAETAEVRSAVPAAHREQFDELLGEARHTFRIKDERGVYANDPANGLLRRAILDGGRRLAGGGLVDDSEHLVEAGQEELHSLLNSGRGPSPTELADRFEYRTTHTHREIPLVLGSPDGGPVPVEWLPAEAQRVARALAMRVPMIAGEEPAPDEAAAVRGTPASPGSYEGPARLVRSLSDFDRIQHGDVLVAPGTSPAISALLPLLRAIVTDHGGPLSHVAIVAREMGIPAVVGCGDATDKLADGVLVRVDRSAGTVAVID